MNSDKKRLYVLSLSLVAVLLSCFFIGTVYKAVFLAVAVAVFAGLTFYFIKKRAILSLYKGQVLMILSVCALLYVMLYFLSGVHFGFYRTSRRFAEIIRAIFLTAVTVVALEYIRAVFLGQNKKWVSVLIFIACVLVDVLPNFNLNYISRFNRFMDFLGLTLFPALTFNWLYSYLAKRFGSLPAVSYKLITVIIPLIIPVKPNIPTSLLSLAQLIVPIIILAFIKMLFEKKKREKKRVSKAVSVMATCVVLAFMVGVMAVISCQFRFCALVIATESMTGELNKGDMVVYERYDGGRIKENQILVFDMDGSTTVHRVVKVEIIDGQYRYTTKGDFNDSNDSGYITASDIQGVVHFKLAYLGYPTLIFRDIFKK